MQRLALVTVRSFPRARPFNHLVGRPESAMGVFSIWSSLAAAALVTIVASVRRTRNHSINHKRSFVAKRTKPTRDDFSPAADKSAKLRKDGKCRTCLGTGRVRCRFCQGTGRRSCGSCGGSGRRFGATSKSNPSGMSNCPFCFGGRAPCSCRGREENCRDCSGSGRAAVL